MILYLISVSFVSSFSFFGWRVVQESELRTLHLLGSALPLEPWPQLISFLEFNFVFSTCCGEFARRGLELCFCCLFALVLVFHLFV